MVIVIEYIWGKKVVLVPWAPCLFAVDVVPPANCLLQKATGMKAGSHSRHMLVFVIMTRDESLVVDFVTRHWFNCYKQLPKKHEYVPHAVKAEGSSP